MSPKFVYNPPPKVIADSWTSFREEADRRRHFLHKQARDLLIRARRLQRERAK